MLKQLIYIIDDDPVFTTILSNHLKRHQQDYVKVFSDGESSLESMNTENPSFIFLDFSLERLNGLDVLKRIKSKNKKAKVIIITSIEDEILKRKCIDNGAILYINKSEVIDDIPDYILKRLKKKWYFLFR